MEGSAISSSSIASALDPTPMAETPTMDEFSAQLERFERWLNMLESNLGPVLLSIEGVPSDDVNKVAEVPATRFHHRVNDLNVLLNRAEDIRSRIRL